jgi:transposase-like protein
MPFPRERRPKIRSTDPLEPVNLEIACRSEVVGVYPTTRRCYESRPAS